MAHIVAFEQRLQAVNEDAELEAIEASLNGAIFSEPETASAVNGRGFLNFLLVEEEAQTTFVDNKFNSKVNDDPIQVEKVADKGNKTLNNDVIPVKKVVDKGKTKMVEDDHPVIPVKKVVGKGKTKMVEDDHHVILVKKAVDKSKTKMVEDDHPVKKHMRRNKRIVIEENVNPSVMDSVTDSEVDPDVEINFTLYSDSDSEYSDKSVDYLSQGEDELMDLRKRKTKAKKALKSSNKQTLPDKVGSSSSIRQKMVYEVGGSDTIIEHEEFMDELIRKLRDEGDGIIDPFKIVESKVEKCPIHDVNTHCTVELEQETPMDSLGMMKRQHALSNALSLLPRATSTITSTINIRKASD
ncbi:hypothetical protein Tco_0597299 [Tanacetum coccineum]